MEIDEIICSIEERLQAVLKSLNWTEKELLESVTHTNLQNDKKTITQSYETAQHEEPLWPYSLPSENSIILDQIELRKLLNKPNAEVPQKFSELQLNFNREEKLQIYEHVVKSSPTPNNINVNSLFEHEKLFGEIVAKQKREKKRRHKYRTIRPTYVEEVRNVVEMQMSALQQYLRPKLDKTKVRNSRESARKRSRSRIKSRSSSRRRSKSHRHRSHNSRERHKNTRYYNSQRSKK